MSFLERLNAESPSGIVEYLDNRKRSLIGLKGNILVPGGVPTPEMTRKGAAIYFPNLGTNVVSFGNGAPVQISNGTIFAVAARRESVAAAFHGIFAKVNAYGMYFNSTAEPKAFGCYDFGTPGFKASTFSEGPTGLLHLFAMSFQSGVVNGTSFFVDGAPRGLATITITSQALALYMGFGASVNQGLGGPVVMGGLSNRIWTPAEHAELFYDFTREGFVGQIARRNFVYVYPNLNASEYAAKGIVLDTDFGSEYPAGVRKIRDLTGNYPGTIVGTPIPGPNGEGTTFKGGADADNRGDVVGLNNATKFTIYGWIEPPAGNIAFASNVFSKFLDASHLIVMQMTAAASPSQTVQVGVYNGATSNATSAGALRSGVKQFFAVTYDGGGATDADRLKLRMDASQRVLTFPGAAIPATAPNLAGRDFRLADGFAATFTGLTVRTGVALTDAQLQAEYLKGAQQLDLRVTLEDTPVSLVASVAAPGQIGPYQIVNGSWACVESSTGKRSLKNINNVNEAVSIPSNAAFGTWYYKVRTPAVGPLAEVYQLFIASQPGRYSAAGQNGYMLYLNITTVTLFRMTGAVSAAMANSGPGVLALDTEYDVCINRRPSDCRFTVWMRGGGWGNTWTQIMQVAEASHVTSSYINLASSTAAAQYPQFDFQDKSVALLHWPGQLDPTQNELPLR